MHALHTHIYAELAEMGKPVGGYSIEGVGVVDRVNDANDMGLANLGFEVQAVLWASCEKHLNVNFPDLNAGNRPPESTM